MTHTIVQFTPHTPVGDVVHRKTWPMQALASLPEFRVIDVHSFSPYRYHLSFEADLLIVDTTFDPEFIPVLKWRAAAGKPTVFEVQDHIFDSDPWNPGFSVSNDPSTQAECLQMMAMVDLVQTTTPYLAEVFEPHCKRVVFFPNQLKEAPDGLPERPERPLVIGWGGSDGHICDMARIAHPVSDWIRAHEDVVLAIMGSKPIADLFDVSPDRLRFRPPQEMEAYEGFLDGVHIGLAPLRDTPTNRARTDVKWLEYAAHGCVFVGQRTPVYTGTVHEGTTGFLFDDVNELIHILDRLYEDRALMETVKQSAFELAVTTRLHGQHTTDRAAVYTELLEREREAEQTFDLDVRSTFPRPDLPDPLPDYLAIVLEHQEEEALGTVYSPGDTVPEGAIRFLEQRYGEFHLTAQAKARIAIARRDFPTAASQLRRSLSLYPAGVRSLILLGRTLASMNQLDDAKTALSDAIRWNDGCGPAYRYLAALAEQQSDWSEAMEITRTWQSHCPRDPLAPAQRGAILVKSGETEKGIDLLSQTMADAAAALKGWQASFAAELVNVCRQVDAVLSDDPRWVEALVKAAETCPYSLWLAMRAGEALFRQGEYGAGARVLQGACDRLMAWEWQTVERGNPQGYRRVVELYRQACEELAD